MNMRTQPLSSVICLETLILVASLCCLGSTVQGAQRETRIQERDVLDILGSFSKATDEAEASKDNANSNQGATSRPASRNAGSLEMRLAALQNLVKQLENKGLNSDAQNEDDSIPTIDKFRCTGPGPTEVIIKGKKVRILCDKQHRLVIQLRYNGKVDFNRGWDYYVDGFGNRTGEFWLGLENIYQISLSARYELHLYLKDSMGQEIHLYYDDFCISGSEHDYRLEALGKFLRSENYNAMAGSVGHKFSTKERDRDSSNTVNCAGANGGGWWFGDCGDSSLNGPYSLATSRGKYIRWSAKPFPNNPITLAVMSLKPHSS